MIIFGRQLAHLDGHDVRDRETRRLGPENQTSRGKPSVFGPLEYNKSGFGEGTGAGSLRALGGETPERESRCSKRRTNLSGRAARATGRRQGRERGGQSVNNTVVWV